MAQQLPPGPTREPAAVPPAPPQLPNEPYYRRKQSHTANRRPLAIALIIVGLIWLLSASLPSAPWFGQISAGESTIVDQTITARRFVLDAGSADVELTHGTQPTIHIEALQRGGATNEFSVNLQQDGETLRVNATSNCLVFCTARLRYRIELPAETAVAVQSTSGDVTAKSLSSGVDIKTTSGDVKLIEISGPLTISSVSGDVSLSSGQASGANVNTTSGSIDLQGVADALVVKSISGDITIEEARNGRLSIDTTSGSVRYDGSLAPGSDNRIGSISGEVQIQLPEAAGMNVDASSVSGDLSTDFDLNGTKEAHVLRGAVGDGAAILKITTTSGDVQIEKR
jgi:hypothetical protein